MERFTQQTFKTPGLPPGTLIHVGVQTSDKIRINLMNYSPKHLQEKEIQNIEELIDYKNGSSKIWIDIDGLHHPDLIEKVGKCFGIHPLTLEDILNTNQRPKTEIYDNYIFIVFKMLRFDEDEKVIKSEQLSLILGNNYLISFQEDRGDVFDIIRERIRKGKGKIREAGCDYLAYALIDAVVDHYFLILEVFSEQITSIEESLFEDTSHQTLENIHSIKREMIFFRRQILPIRELLSSLRNEEGELINKSTVVYLNDVYDHTIQLMDHIESLRDMLSGIQEIYLSSMSNKMNEVMKILTIFTTLFSPITFLVGVYGMNFKYMPELEWKWSYFIVWAVIALLIVLMVIFFRKKNWL